MCISFKTYAKQNLVVIKSTTNKGETNIGDYWIAEDLAKGFEAYGYDTDIDYRGEYHKKREFSPLINVYMRGYTRFEQPYSDGMNVLYVYYPMAYHKNSSQKVEKNVLNSRIAQPENTFLDDDWRNYDVIAVASLSFAKELNDNGINAVYIPQFTNPDKFYPEKDDKLATDILFVGSNWHDRTSLRYAIESGFNVDVYGYNWARTVPDNMYKATYIPNTELRRYYSSAKIILNDHRPDMKKFGFVNNRIYDATACGALVISDYMPEIEYEYGDSVPMYKDKEELAKLIKYYLDNEDERIALAQKARAITLSKFTNQIIARKIKNQLY